MVEPRLPNAPQLPPLADLAKPSVERTPLPAGSAASAARSASGRRRIRAAARGACGGRRRAAPMQTATPADRIEPEPSAHAETMPPRPRRNLPPPAEDDAPGAFMDVLSRADAEAQAAEEKRKPS